MFDFNLVKIASEKIKSGSTLSEALDVAEARRIYLSEEWIQVRLRSSKPLGRIALAREVPGLEGISRAEGASGFLESHRSSFDLSEENLNVRFWAVCGSSFDVSAGDLNVRF